MARAQSKIGACLTFLILLAMVAVLLPPGAGAQDSVPVIAQQGDAATISIPEDVAALRSSVRFTKRGYLPDTECVQVTVIDPHKAGTDQLMTVTLAVADEEGHADIEPDLPLEHVEGDTFASPCLDLVTADADLANGTLEGPVGARIAAFYNDPENPDREPVSAQDLAANFDVGMDAVAVADATLAPELRIRGARPGHRLATATTNGHTSPIYFVDVITVLVRNQQDLDDVFALVDGTVIEGSVESGSVDIHLDPQQASAYEFAPAAGRAGVNGMMTFPSIGGALLMTIVYQLRAEGILASVAPAVIGTGAPQVGTDVNADVLDDTDHKWSDAVAVLDLMDRDQAESVSLAIVDSGFATLADYAAVNGPLGLALPTATDYGRAVDDIAQTHCGSSCAVGDDQAATGPGGFPICASGPGPDCDFHGTGSALSAFGVHAGGFGTGVAGVARNAEGVIGQLPLVEPMLINMGGTGVLHNMARGIDAAVDAGAEIVSVSAGVPCQPLAIIDFGLDFCNPLGSIAAFFLCVVIGALVSPALALLLGPLGALLGPLVGPACVGVVVAFTVIAGTLGRGSLQNALDRAAGAGILVVVSGPEPITLGDISPTDASVTDFVPCILRNAFCVGVADFNARTARLSTNSFSTGIDLWVHDFNAVLFPGARTHFSGTSASAPNAAGAAAMLIAASDGRLSGVEAGRILQNSSLPLTAGLAGTCVIQPNGAGCVGKMDIRAAVITAAGTDAPTCTQVEPVQANDTAAYATNLGELPIGTLPGELRTEEFSRSDMAIHALPSDEDWLRFDPPNGAVTNGLSGATKIEILADERYGDLAIEVSQIEASQSQVSQSQPLINHSNTYEVDWQLPVYVKVTSAGDEAVDDTCYGLRVTTKVNPLPDFAARQTLSGPVDWPAPFSPADHDYDCAPGPCKGILRWSSAHDMSHQTSLVTDWVTLPIPDVSGDLPADVSLTSLCSSTQIPDPLGLGATTYYNVNAKLIVQLEEAVNPLSVTEADLNEIPMWTSPAGVELWGAVELSCHDLAGLDTWELEVGSGSYSGFAIGGYTMRFTYEIAMEVERLAGNGTIPQPHDCLGDAGGVGVPGNPIIIPNPNGGGGGGDICGEIPDIPLPGDNDPIDLPELPGPGGPELPPLPVPLPGPAGNPGPGSPDL